MPWNPVANLQGPPGTDGSPFPRDIQLLVTDPNGDDLQVGDGQAWFMVPQSLAGKRLVAVAAGLVMASSDGDVVVDVTLRAAGFPSSPLATPITIEEGQASSYTAAVQPVVNPAVTLSAANFVGVDVDAAGTAARGLCVVLTVDDAP